VVVLFFSAPSVAPEASTPDVPPAAGAPADPQSGANSGDDALGDLIRSQEP